MDLQKYLQEAMRRQLVAVQREAGTTIREAALRRFGQVAKVKRMLIDLQIQKVMFFVEYVKKLLPKDAADNFIKLLTTKDNDEKIVRGISIIVDLGSKIIIDNRYVKEGIIRCARETNKIIQNANNIVDKLAKEGLPLQHFTAISLPKNIMNWNIWNINDYLFVLRDMLWKLMEIKAFYSWLESFYN